MFSAALTWRRFHTNPSLVKCIFPGLVYQVPMWISEGVTPIDACALEFKASLKILADTGPTSYDYPPRRQKSYILGSDLPTPSYWFEDGMLL